MHFLIVIPTYNRPKLLLEAVDSILGQDHQDWHLIVSDNRSEIPAEVVLGSRLDDSRIHVMLQPVHLGGTEHGFRICRAIIDEQYDFVGFMADDDYMVPGSLSHIAGQSQLDDLVAGNISYFYQKSGDLIATGQQFVSDVTSINGESALLHNAASAGVSVLEGKVEIFGEIPETHISFYFLSKSLMHKLDSRFGGFLVQPFGDIGLGRVKAFCDTYSYLRRPIGIIRFFDNYGQGLQNRSSLLLHHQVNFLRSPLKHVSFANCAAESYLTVLSDLDIPAKPAPRLFLRHLREILRDKPKTMQTVCAFVQGIGATIKAGQVFNALAFAVESKARHSRTEAGRTVLATDCYDMRTAAEILLAQYSAGVGKSA